MGFLIGGIFGSMMGVVWAYKTGNILYIPLRDIELKMNCLGITRFYYKK